MSLQNSSEILAIESRRMDKAFELYQRFEKELIEGIAFLGPVFFLIEDLFDKDSKVQSIINRHGISRKIEMIMFGIILLIVIIFILHFI